MRAAMLDGRIGYMDTPAQGNIRPPGVKWAADNGCFGNGWPGYEKWFAWLERNAFDTSTCIFATAPDVVGDAAATLVRSLPWLPKIRALGYPAAYVAQNGSHETSPPWGDFDVLFLGGSLECLSCRYVWPNNLRPDRRQRCPDCGQLMTEWKLGPKAYELTMEAHRRCVPVHMGRVNSEKRVREALRWGVQTVDGTFIARWPKNIHRLLAWFENIAERPGLDFRDAS